MASIPTTPVNPLPLPVDQDFQNAWNALNKGEKRALEDVRLRAEKFATIATSLTSLFGIGSVLTSIDSLPDIEISWRIGIACLLLLGLASLTASAYLLLPTTPVVSTVNDLRALSATLASARVNRALKELKYLEFSKGFTLLGLILISLAMALSWFAPRMGN